MSRDADSVTIGVVLAFLAAVLLTSPVPLACRWWSRAERRCRDSDVEYLGAWDPRPPPQDWGANDYKSPPPDFGAYATEKHEP